MKSSRHPRKVLQLRLELHLRVQASRRIREEFDGDALVDCAK